MQPVMMTQDASGQLQYAVNYPSLTQANAGQAGAAHTQPQGQVTMA